MVWLANFSLKGYSQAVFSLSLTLLLTVVFPPIFWLNSALIGFLIYHRSGKELVQITSLTLLFSFLVLQFGIGAGMAVIGLGLMWLPVIIAVYLAKRFNAYALGSEVLVLLSLISVVVVFAIFGDLTEYWKELVKQLLTNPNMGASEAELQQLLEGVGTSTTGWIVSGVLLGSLLSYTLAGFWCRILQKNVIKDMRFGNIHFSKMLSIIGIAVLITSLSKWVLFENMVPSVIVGFSFVGIAIVHQLILEKTKSRAWLLGFYFLLIMLFGQVSLFLAIIGLTDFWMHYRYRLTKNT